MRLMFVVCVCFFKQKTAYEMRISDWSSDVCSSDLQAKVDLWLADFGGVGRDAQVAAHRQLQAAAQGEAVDHRDHRLGHLLHPPHHALAALRDVAPLYRREAGTLGDVGKIGSASCRERGCTYVEQSVVGVPNKK